jgi:hypothetical protein
MKKMIFVLSILTASSAFAQEQPADPVLLQRMLGTAIADRNSFLNAATEANAKLGIANEELAKARARIKELETKPAEPAK